MRAYRRSAASTRSTDVLRRGVPRLLAHLARIALVAVLEAAPQALPRLHTTHTNAREDMMVPARVSFTFFLSFFLFFLIMYPFIH